MLELNDTLGFVLFECLDRNSLGTPNKHPNLWVQIKTAQGINLCISINTCLGGKFFLSSCQSACFINLIGWVCQASNQDTGNGKTQHKVWLSQLKCWGTDLVTSLNPQISEKLMYREGYQPGKAATPDGLAHSWASFSGEGFLSYHPKLHYSTKAREARGYKSSEASHFWIVLSAKSAGLLR